MKFKKLLCIVLAVLILCASVCGCNSGANDESSEIDKITVSSDKINKIENEVDKILKLGEFYGCAAITFNKQIVYNKSFGYSTSENDKKWDSKSPFLIHMLTRTITSAAIFKLADEKKLSLKDKLSKYFNKDEYGLYLDEITVGDLLTDKVKFGTYLGIINQDPTYGPIINKYLDAENSNKYNKQISDIIEEYILKKGALPENSASASNYYLLGKIITKTSGTGYREYVQKNIYDKLGMINSGFVNSDLDLQSADMNNKKWTISENANYYRSFGYMFSAFGVVSCTEDLAKFFMALLNGKLDIDFQKGVKQSIGNRYCGFLKYGNSIFQEGGIASHYIYVQLNLEKRETVILLSNYIGKTDFVITGQELYNVINSKVNGIILSDIK